MVEIQATGDVRIEGNQASGDAEPVQIETTEYFKVRTKGNVFIGGELGEGENARAVEIRAAGAFEVLADGNIETSMYARGGEVKIRSKTGNVIAIDSVLRGFNLIDIEAALLADLARAKLGIVDGSAIGRIEVEGTNINLEETDLIGPVFPFDIDGAVEGTPRLFITGTVPE
jgi:hypothetical protein